jgi:hypothetical protein
MLRLIACATVFAAWPRTARGEPRCVQVLGWRSVDCPAEVERAPDRAEGAFWRQRNTGPPPPSRLTGPIIPGIGPANLMFGPALGSPAREGALTLDDLVLRPDGRGGYQGRRPCYQFTIERDGTIHFDDPPPIHGFTLAGLGFAAVFDLTDLVMRARHIDPYVHDKGQVAELTRTMRDKMSAVERPRRLAVALARLPGELEALWRRSDLSLAERRETLFGLWDDLLEDDSTGAGAPEIEAAAQARAELLRFVRQRLPRDGTGGFTDGELGRLNARRHSRMPFAPYRD